MLGKVIVAGALAGVGWLGYSHYAADDNTRPQPRAAAPHQGSGSASGADAAPRYIAVVEHTWDQEGELYRVRPTRSGRLVSPGELRTAWQQAVGKGVPNQQGLRHQFYCHPLSIVARGKPTWDLEVWRPAVGLRRTMLSGCNPA